MEQQADLSQPAQRLPQAPSHVGVSMLQYARLGRGRTDSHPRYDPRGVALETGTYECSGVVKNDDGTRARGYKLATLRTAARPRRSADQMAMSAIQVHDMALCRPLLEEAPGVACG